jgi:DNA-binding MarR family transcriptional regulator
VPHEADVHEPDTGWLLARASHALASAVAARLRDLGLSLRGYVVLTAALDRPLPQQALAGATGLDKTTMVVTVDELAAAGLVERRPDPADRRVRLVAVTDAGRATLGRAWSVVRTTEDELLGDLGEERAVLRRLLLTALDGRLGAHSGGGSCV